MDEDDVFQASCFGRAGLLGNPSDGYGGRVIAVTLPQFSAAVEITGASQWDFDENVLLEATVRALRTRWPKLVARPAAMRFETSIPRQVGLSGSSAIVIAALRALALRSAAVWDNVDLARTALEVETEVLGWSAGPQDRVVQAMEGLLDMDFAQSWQASRYHRIDLGLLPQLFVAWDRSAGEPSDVAHSDVRERWEAGDPEVLKAMKDFAQLATDGRKALDAGSAGELWPQLMRQSFAIRSRVWAISARDLQLVEAGESVGAGVSFAGSGGAVVGVIPPDVDADSVADVYQAAGAGFSLWASR